MFERKIRANLGTRRVAQHVWPTLQPFNHFKTFSCAAQRGGKIRDLIGLSARLFRPWCRPAATAASSSSIVVITATEEITHVDVLLWLFFLLCWLLLFSSGTTGTGSSWSGATATATSSDIWEKLGNVLTLESLGEESWPVTLNGVSASLDDLGKFLFL